MKKIAKPQKPTVKAHSKTAAVATAVSLTVAALTGLGATANKVSTVQVIYVQNKSSFVSDKELKNALPAFQAATSKDFAPLWHVDAKLVYLPRAKDVPAGSEVITLVDKGPVAGALAYHELVNGIPDSIIYVGTSKFYGYSWSVALTHELFEMLADPSLVRTAQSQDGRIWANEVCDPVESDADGYDRPGANGKPVRISDFVTDRWYGAETVGPYDFMNRVQEALVIRPGGYAQWFDGFQWVVITNFVKGGLGDNGAFYG